MPELLPGERPLVKRRRSMIVLLEPPGRVVGVVLLAVLAATVFGPLPMTIAGSLILAAAVLWRFLDWRAKWVMLTDKRIIRIQGFPEPTEIEAFLRVDRISGVVLERGPIALLCNYGTVRLEAPGDHPALRTLDKVAGIDSFYRVLRDVIFGTTADPEDEPGEAGDYVTAPLPVIRERPGPPPRDHLGRRQGW